MPMRAGKIAGIIAYVLFVIAFVEIALQIFYFVMAGDFLFNRVAPALYQKESSAGFMNKPNLSFEHHTNEFRAHYLTNEAGFRVPNSSIHYATAKPVDTYRILLLGPSFAYGWGVEYEKTFAAQLPQILAKRGFAKGKRIEVINAGVPAIPPASQLVWYRDKGSKYHPDLVMQFIYGSMAVRSNPHSTITADEKGYLTDSTLSSGQIWRERLKQSAIIFYGWLIYTEMDSWFSGPNDTSNATVKGAGREMSLVGKFDLSDPQVQDAVKFYEELGSTTKKSGADLLVVYFPLSYTIYPEDQSRWKHLGVKDVNAQSSFDSAFSAYLNGRKIPTANITDDLQKESLKNPRLYYWLDIHWTPEGNAAAANAVANYLVRKDKSASPTR